MNTKRMQQIAVRLLVLMLPFVVARGANAQLYGNKTDSAQHHQIEVKFGSYTPDIDGEAGIDAYSVVFDDEGMFASRLEYDFQFFQSFGSLAIGGEIGYAQVTGKGRVLDASSGTGYGGESSDETTFKVIPMSLGLVYNLDIMAIRWNVPLVPFIKAGVDYNVWWITDGVEETTSYTDESGKKHEGSGGTMGWHISTGIKLLLDSFAPQMARTFDIEVGVNNSYLVAEVVYADINDFGSKKSFQLGGTSFNFGLAFEY